MRSVELFAGAGGMAIGMHQAGFEHAAVLEWNHDACETFRDNRKRNAYSLDCWPLHEGDVRDFEYGGIKDVMVVSGGPPCQPFSLGGKHGGYSDSRDMFPEAVRAVRELRPKAFVFENVKGLMRESFSDYFEYIHLQLTHPGLGRRQAESWREHRTRLEQHQTARGERAEYQVVYRLLNAANYGVPQRRERVFLVGFRADLGIEWSFPEETHSEDSLLKAQWIAGDYWERHQVAKRNRPSLSERQKARVAKLKQGSENLFEAMPWLTVRDAIGDLPDPEKQTHHNVLNHKFNAGARTYPGHTGSPYDEPAKTLKAGDHGVPGGENMLARADGSVRYFTIREAARIQTFPDDYVFRGSWSEAMRQLGNAVPVRLAEAVGRSVAGALRKGSRG
ncbi:MAG: DNA cytosine methyltransferase [Acidobacteria bacterium]|nr:DNA cytosine methyltransferase [Acidobacteriota bacterium]